FRSAGRGGTGTRKFSQFAAKTRFVGCGADPLEGPVNPAPGCEVLKIRAIGTSWHPTSLNSGPAAGYPAPSWLGRRVENTRSLNP
ncbi:MAG: hypothetical protein Q9193_003583, partial [Seirophora villosa]